MLIYFNQESFNQDEYGEYRIMRQSTIQNVQVDEYRPNYIFANIWKNQLGDEIELLQWGEEEELDFNHIEFDPPRPSAWGRFPTTDEPDNRYKFSSIAFKFIQNSKVIERQTYSLLEWLGDIGGLFDALKLIGAALVAQIAGFSMEAQLLNAIFRFVASLRTVNPKIDEADETEKLQRHLSWDFDQLRKIPQAGCCKLNEINI